MKPSKWFEAVVFYTLVGLVISIAAVMDRLCFVRDMVSYLLPWCKLGSIRCRLQKHSHKVCGYEQIEAIVRGLTPRDAERVLKVSRALRCLPKVGITRYNINCRSRDALYRQFRKDSLDDLPIRRCTQRTFHSQG